MATAIAERGVSQGIDQARARWVADNRAEYERSVCRAARGETLDDEALLQVDDYLAKADLAREQFATDTQDVRNLPANRAAMRRAFEEVGCENFAQLEKAITDSVADEKRLKVEILEAHRRTVELNGRRSSHVVCGQFVANVERRIPAAAEVVESEPEAKRGLLGRFQKAK